MIRQYINITMPFKSKLVAPNVGRSCKEAGRQGSGKLSDDEYLKLFHEVYGDKYTYDMTRDVKYRITLFCPEHGASKLLPSHIANQK